MGAVPDSIRVEREGHLARLIINRPEKRNALNMETLAALPRVTAELDNDPSIRVVIVRGAGDKAFSAGGDISEFSQYWGSREDARKWHSTLVGGIDSVFLMTTPTVACIHGPAIGAGCEVAAACDFRLTAEDGRFGITSSRLGFPFPYHNAVRLVSLIGPAQAKRLLLTSEILDAAEALRIGLVNKVVAKDGLEDAVLDLAGVLAERAPMAQKASIKVINDVLQDPSLSGVEDQEAMFAKCFTGNDLKEGVAAFMERRPPVFRGE